MKPGDRASQLEAVQVAAMTAFRDVSGYRIIDDGDLLRTVALGRPHAFLNGVLRLNLDGDGLQARVRSVAAEYGGSASVWRPARERTRGSSRARQSARAESPHTAPRTPRCARSKSA